MKVNQWKRAKLVLETIRNEINKIANRGEPRRPPMTDVGTETTFMSDSTSASISKKVNISWGQRSVDAIKPVYNVLAILTDYLLPSEWRRTLRQADGRKQTSIDLHLRRSTGTCTKWEDRSTCVASRISTQKEPFPRSEFTPGPIWTYWKLIDRQMQSAFMPELQRWISKLTARYLQLVHQEIFWSPW